MNTRKDWLCIALPFVVLLAILVVVGIAGRALFYDAFPHQPLSKPDGIASLKSEYIPESFKKDTARDSRWHALRDKIVKAHPFCAYCGGTTKLQAHHIRPFHLEPDLELDPSNVIVLCEDPATDHHLKIGHLGNFQSEGNPRVVEDCEANEAKMRKDGTWPQK